MTKKPATNLALIAYHDKCLDGMTACYVTSLAMEERGQCYSCVPMSYDDESYANLARAVSSGRYNVVYIVDFSVPLEVLKVLVGYGVTVTVIDHHKTAFENYAIHINEPGEPEVIDSSLTNVQLVLDNNRSGAGLCWHYFFPEVKVPWIVKYVQDRDLWKFRYRDTKAIAAFLGEATKDLLTWGRLHILLDEPSKKAVCINDGYSLLQKWNEEVNAIAADAKPVGINGIGGYVVRCHGKYASDVGNVLAQRGGTFGLTFDVSSDYNAIKYSLRSVGDLDVSAVAKKLGGGGHKNAAGFESDYLPYQLFAAIEE